MWWFAWESWGDDDRGKVNWPHDMRPGGGKSDTGELDERFEGIAAKPLLQVAKKMLTEPVSKIIYGELKNDDEKSTHLTISKCPIFYNEYPDPVNDSLMNRKLIFHKVTDEIDFMKDLKAGLSNAPGFNPKNGLAASKSIEVGFSFSSSDKKVTITLMASKPTDFKPVSADFEFDDPSKAYKAIAALL